MVAIEGCSKREEEGGAIRMPTLCLGYAEDVLRKSLG